MNRLQGRVERARMWRANGLTPQQIRAVFAAEDLEQAKRGLIEVDAEVVVVVLRDEDVAPRAPRAVSARPMHERELGRIAEIPRNAGPPSRASGPPPKLPGPAIPGKAGPPSRASGLLVKFPAPTAPQQAGPPVATPHPPKKPYVSIFERTQYVPPPVPTKPWL